MKSRLAIIIVILMATVAGFGAQQPTTSKQAAGPAQVTKEVLTGEVVWILGNVLVAKMQPKGDFRVFNVEPGREFLIDGQKKLIGDLRLGTVLTATIITTTQPVTIRTTTVLNGTVRWVAGNYVVLKLPTGEEKGYTVSESFQFLVNGRPAMVRDLKIGMNVTATKIVEDPQTEISSGTVITGKGPK
jgi:hypothetical protein